MVKLVDTQVLETCAARRAGSSPALGISEGSATGDRHLSRSVFRKANTTLTITVTDQEHCKKQIHIEIPSDAVREEIERKATKYARQASIPGFRPGKAPVSVIKTRFHKELRDEVMAELLPTTFDNAVKEHSFKVVSEPKVQDMQYGDDDSLTATFTFEVAPEFDLPEYKNLGLIKKVLKTTDEEVDKAIAMLREGRAELVPVEDRGAQEGDTVTLTLSGKADLDYTPPDDTPEATEEAAAEEPEEAAAEAPSGTTDETGAEAAAAEAGDGAEEEVDLPGEVQEESVDIEIGAEGTLAEFNAELAGVRAGEKKTITVTYPKSYPDPAYANRRWHFDVEVTAVRTKELPEMDEEFISSLDESLHSVDDLRARIRSNFEQRNSMLAEEGLRNAAVEKLVGANRFDVPEEMVQKQMQERFSSSINRLMSAGIDVRSLNLDWKAMIESHREQARDDVRGFFLLERIAEAESLEASDDEVDEEIEQMAEARGESVSILMARLTRENALDTIKGQIRHQKALDFVINSADIKEEVKEAEESEPDSSKDENQAGDNQAADSADESSSEG